MVMPNGPGQNTLREADRTLSTVEDSDTRLCLFPSARFELLVKVFRRSLNMALIFRCSKCDEEYRVDWSKAGASGTCRQCGAESTGSHSPAEGVAAAGDVELSANGAPVWRHEERKIPFQLATGDGQNIELISEHIEEHLGPVGGVYHEMISDLVHIDIHVVEPCDDHPCYRLVTSGMSDAPMSAPEEFSELRFAELMVSLPPHWKVNDKAFKKERWYWPVRWLKMLARMPHEYDTWLGFGHTIPNGDPPEPFDASTDLCCASLAVLPHGFRRIFTHSKSTTTKAIQFYSLFPIYEEEMNFKLDRGVDDLIDRFDKHEIFRHSRSTTRKRLQTSLEILVTRSFCMP